MQRKRTIGDLYLQDKEFLENLCLLFKTDKDTFSVVAAGQNIDFRCFYNGQTKAFSEDYLYRHYIQGATLKNALEMTARTQYKMDHIVKVEKATITLKVKVGNRFAEVNYPAIYMHYNGKKMLVHFIHASLNYSVGLDATTKVSTTDYEYAPNNPLKHFSKTTEWEKSILRLTHWGTARNEEPSINEGLDEVPDGMYGEVNLKSFSKLANVSTIISHILKKSLPGGRSIIGVGDITQFDISW